MAKNNVRSFRFDDDIAKIIDEFEGQNGSDKFDNLVRFCFKRLPETEKRLKELDKQIEAKRKLLADMTRQTQQIDNLMSDLKQTKTYVERVSKQARDIAENM